MTQHEAREDERSALMLLKYTIISPSGTEHLVEANGPMSAIKQILPGACFPSGREHAEPRWTVRLAQFEPMPCWSFVAE